jgi:hypothetical protein
VFYPRFEAADLDVPLMFLSRQILSKFAKSNDGRVLSIGMQYLEIKPREVVITGTEADEPYRVQSLLQFPLLRPTTNKVLHDLQLPFTPGLKSSGVVENITIVLCKGNFVLDVMQATLRAGSSGSAIADGISLPNFHRTFELNLAR